MPLAHVCRCRGCPGCGPTGCGYAGVDVVGARCPACAPTRDARERRRRAAKPQRQVWDSARWRRFRARARRLLGDRCVDCGRHASQLGPNERMLVDHKRGLAVILAEGGDPFDLVEVELRCSTDSGRRDGGRERAI